MLLYWILLPIVWVLAHIVFRIQVIGRENLKAVRDGRAYVIAPNHIANLGLCSSPLRFFDWKRLRILAKEELFKKSVGGVVPALHGRGVHRARQGRHRHAGKKLRTSAKTAPAS